MSQMGTTPEQKPEIYEAVDYLNCHVAEGKIKIKSVLDRLAPLMHPSSTTVSEKEKPLGAPVICQHANDIYKIANRVKFINETLTDILCRLEI